MHRCMRRQSILHAKKKAEERQRRTKIIVSVIVAGLFILSVFSVMLYSPTAPQGQQVQDGGQGFSTVTQGQQTYYQTEIDGVDRQFLFLPSTTRTIPAEFNQSILDAQMVAVGFDPTQDNLSVIDYARSIISRDFSERGQVPIPVTTANSSQYDMDVIDCTTTDTSGFIFLYANTTRITQEGSCVLVQGTGPSQLLQALEQLRYRYYGVI